MKNDRTLPGFTNEQTSVDQKESARNGEIKTIKRFRDFGFHVFDYARNQLRYDLVVAKDGKQFRLQVKNSENMKHWVIQAGRGKIDNPKNWHEYTKEDTDAMVLISGDDYWIIPIEEVHGIGVHAKVSDISKRFPQYQNNFALTDTCTTEIESPSFIGLFV